jgi:hypothetical protein
VTAFGQLKPSVPFVVRLDGTNDEEGRRILAEADLPNVFVEKTMLGAAARVVELAGGASGGADGVPPDTGTASSAVVSGTEAAPAEAGDEGTTPR